MTRRTITHRAATALAASLLASVALAAGPGGGDLDPQLEPLRPMIGKTWRGTLPPSQPGKQAVDVQRWERALNGKAVRILHSVNDGEYGGESIMVWDRDKQSLVFYYFTTAGFYTTGTGRFVEGALVTSETVKGKSDVATEVTAVLRVLPDGRLHVKTQYVKDGKPAGGRDMHYVEDSTAEVRFK